MSTDVRLIDEETAMESIGRLAQGKLSLEVVGALAGEIARWVEDHPDLPIVSVSVRSGACLQKLWVLFSAMEAQRADVRRSNDALMLFKSTWNTIERGIRWHVPSDARTVLYTH